MQREAASKLVAAAKRLAVEAARSSKRRRVVQRPAERVHSPDHILLGARVAVYWRDDKQFYKVMSCPIWPSSPSSHMGEWLQQVYKIGTSIQLVQIGSNVLEL